MVFVVKQSLMKKTLQVDWEMLQNEGTLTPVRVGIDISLRTCQGVTEIYRLEGEGLLEGIRATMSLSVIL